MAAWLVEPSPVIQRSPYPVIVTSQSFCYMHVYFLHISHHKLDHTLESTCMSCLMLSMMSKRSICWNVLSVLCFLFMAEKYSAATAFCSCIRWWTFWLLYSSTTVNVVAVNTWVKICDEHVLWILLGFYLGMKLLNQMPVTCWSWAVVEDTRQLLNPGLHPGGRPWLLSARVCTSKDRSPTHSRKRCTNRCKCRACETAKVFSIMDTSSYIL